MKIATIKPIHKTVNDAEVDLWDFRGNNSGEKIWKFP